MPPLVGFSLLHEVKAPPDSGRSGDLIPHGDPEWVSRIRAFCRHSPQKQSALGFRHIPFQNSQPQMKCFFDQTPLPNPPFFFPPEPPSPSLYAPPQKISVFADRSLDTGDHLPGSPSRTEFLCGHPLVILTGYPSASLQGWSQHKDFGKGLMQSSLLVFGNPRSTSPYRRSLFQITPQPMVPPERRSTRDNL